MQIYANVCERVATGVSYWSCGVESVESVTHDTYVYRLAFPAGVHMIVPPGRHVAVTACVNGTHTFSAVCLGFSGSCRGFLVHFRFFFVLILLYLGMFACLTVVIYRVFFSAEI